MHEEEDEESKIKVSSLILTRALLDTSCRSCDDAVCEGEPVIQAPGIEGCLCTSCASPLLEGAFPKAESPFDEAVSEVTEQLRLWDLIGLGAPAVVVLPDGDGVRWEVSDAVPQDALGRIRVAGDRLEVSRFVAFDGFTTQTEEVER